MSTPTPRTDAVYLEHRYWANEDEATEAIEDLRDLARKLERELATEREKVRMLHKALENIKNSICRTVPDGYSQPCVDESADECDRIINAAMKEETE